MIDLGMIVVDEDKVDHILIYAEEGDLMATLYAKENAVEGGVKYVTLQRSDFLALVRRWPGNPPLA